jgi:hypothetical protein
MAHCSPPHAIKAGEWLESATLVTEAVHALPAWDCHSFGLQAYNSVVHRCGLLCVCWQGMLLVSSVVPAAAVGLHKVAPRPLTAMCSGQARFLMQ